MKELVSFLFFCVCVCSVWFDECFVVFVGIFAVFWSFLSPIVIFQSFLSARDDANKASDSVSMADTLSPILFLVAFALVATSIIGIKYKTPFQV